MIPVMMVTATFAVVVAAAVVCGRGCQWKGLIMVTEVNVFVFGMKIRGTIHRISSLRIKINTGTSRLMKTRAAGVADESGKTNSLHAQVLNA